MSDISEITRTVAIEHAGEKITIEVHVHLSKEEIRAILVPAILDAIGAQIRRSANVRATQAGGTVDMGGMRI